MLLFSNSAVGSLQLSIWRVMLNSIVDGIGGISVLGRLSNHEEIAFSL